MPPLQAFHHQSSLSASPGAPAPQPRSTRLWLLLILFSFLGIGLVDLDGPFVSAHNERQNQTYGVAAYIFRTGWTGVVTPRVPFSLPQHPDQPFTAARLEVPFHGILGWPLAAFTEHHRAVVRLISLLFGAASIVLVHTLLKQVASPLASIAGTATWASAPLLLHFGQIPTPDVLTTCGMLLAFLLASRGALTGSSGAFLFAILAKPSTMIFGLPILTSLLVAQQCRSFRKAIWLALRWGLPALLGLSLWLSLDLLGPDTPWTILAQLRSRHDGSFLQPFYYINLLAGVGPFGLGVAGIVSLAISLRDRQSAGSPWVVAAAATACLVYLCTVVRQITEPQYLLPVVAWLILLSGRGWDRLVHLWSSSTWGKAGSIVIVALHLVVTTILTADLKASRVPDFAELQAIRQHLPASARVGVFYLHYGASPSIWLERNVLAVGRQPLPVETELAELNLHGFTHFVILDLYQSGGGKLANLAKWLTHRSTGPNAAFERPTSHFTAADNQVRTYCDQHFTLIQKAPHTLLYALPKP